VAAILDFKMAAEKSLITDNSGYIPARDLVLVSRVVSLFPIHRHVYTPAVGPTQLVSYTLAGLYTGRCVCVLTGGSEKSQVDRKVHVVPSRKYMFFPFFYFFQTTTTHIYIRDY